VSGDIVQRLRDYQRDPEMSDDDLVICGDAADEIERLRAEVERLRAVLTAVGSESMTYGDGCACSEVYVRSLDRVWKMAHDALLVTGDQP
jgi:hypothetical protein